MSWLRTGMPLPPPSLWWEGGGGGEYAPAQPDSLAVKSPHRPNLPPSQHVDRWREGEIRAPSPAPSSPRSERGREERERGMDRSRASDFHSKSKRRRSPSGERSRLHDRDCYSSPARPRSPSLQSQSAENLRNHWGLVRPYDEPTRLSGHRAHPLDRQVPTSSFSSSVWQQAEACNRLWAREPNKPSDARPRPLHSTDASNRSRSRTLHRAPRDHAQPWDYPTWPAPADPYQRVPLPTSYQEPRASRMMLYDLNQPSQGHHQDAQYTQNSSAVPLVGHSLDTDLETARVRSFRHRLVGGGGLPTVVLLTTLATTQGTPPSRR